MSFADGRKDLRPIIRKTETVKLGFRGKILYRIIEIRGEKKKTYLFDDKPTRKIRNFIAGLPLMKDVRNVKITEEHNLITIERTDEKT